MYFNPRAPYGARQISLPLQRRGNLYFNPRAPYGARQKHDRQGNSDSSISIHAPHTGRDEAKDAHQSEAAEFQSTRPIRGATWRTAHPARMLHFNPRAPYGARLSGPTVQVADVGLFQSTRPIRGATRDQIRRWPGHRDFNPRAPYGARLNPYKLIFVFGKISIHAPHTGRDHSKSGRNHSKKLFQSTRPIRGATCFALVIRLIKGISIHAPHTGRDAPWFCRLVPSAFYFNPRAPYGARRGCLFLCGCSQKVISIHAPHTGRDCGVCVPYNTDGISIHAPHTGRDLQVRYPPAYGHTISIHAPHTGRDDSRHW